MIETLIYYAVYSNNRVPPMTVPATVPSPAELATLFQRREAYRHIRGCERWLESKLPNYHVTGQIEESADGWILQLTIRPRTDQAGES
jgi:hypothetical protein